MHRTVRLLAEPAVASAIVALGFLSPVGVVMPHDPSPGAGHVQTAAGETPAKAPISDGPQYDQIAFGALAGLGVGLWWNAARRRRTTDNP